MDAPVPWPPSRGRWWSWRGCLAQLALLGAAAATAAGCGGGEARQAARDAQRLLDAGRLQEALDAYRSGRQRFPEDPLFPLGEGTALYGLQRSDEAEPALREALRLDPGNPRAWDQLGEVLGARGDFAQAAAAFRQATQLDPMDAAAWKGLGLSAYNLRDYAQARRALEKYLAFARDAPDAISITGLINSLPRTGEDDGAGP